MTKDKSLKRKTPELAADDTEQSRVMERASVVPRVQNNDELGTARYYDSSTMSDITIQFGSHGERTFKGHKLILSSQSLYFRAAFEGSFQEAGANTMILQDDDGDAVQALFEFLYKGTYTAKTRGSEDISTDAAEFNVKVYQVADKYNVPKLRSLASTEFDKSFRSWFYDVLPYENLTHIQPMERMVQTVYAATPPTPEDQLRKTLVALCYDSHSSDGLSPMFWSSANKFPDFAHGIMRQYIGDIENADQRIEITDRVKCSRCKRKWRKVHSIETGYCMLCGIREANWSERTVGSEKKLHKWLQGGT